MVGNEPKENSTLPAMRVSMPVSSERPVADLAASSDTPSEQSEVRRFLLSRGSGSAADTTFHGLMFVSALS